MVDEDTGEELSRRREKLQHAEQGKGQLSRRVGEAEQRNRSDDTEGSDAGKVVEILTTPQFAPFRNRPDQITRSDWQKDERLRGETAQGSEGASTAGESVEGHAQGEDHPDPGKATEGDNLHDHPKGGAGDAHLLQQIEGFTEKETADEDVEERIDEIPEAAIDDAVVVRRPDEGAPVDGEEESREGVGEKIRAFCQGLEPGAQFTPPREQRQDRQHRPGDAVGKGEVGAEMAELFPKDRQRPPESEGDNRPEDGGLGGTGGHGGASKVT